ncbi:MAG: quinolinate synthase NadA [bacterium]
MNSSDKFSEISNLKKEKNAIVLSHTYAVPEVQDVADYVGDSFGLSKQASEISGVDKIVFAGVLFMAETAAMLAPDKKVLLPVADAGCPMADTITADELRTLKRKHPDAAVVCYVNSSSETKAESDVCVTSSNAIKIVRRLKEKQVIFVPDKNLGSYVAEQIPEKEIILWPHGHCYVHSRVSPEDVNAVKKDHPDGMVLMHPECPPEARKKADLILSTGQMAEVVKNKKSKKYIIITEEGIIHHLKSFDKDAVFIPMPAPTMYCSNMKKNRYHDLVAALENDRNIITVPENVAEKARISLERMLELAK